VKNKCSKGWFTIQKLAAGLAKGMPRKKKLSLYKGRRESRMGEAWEGAPRSRGPWKEKKKTPYGVGSISESKVTWTCRKE